MLKLCRNSFSTNLNGQRGGLRDSEGEIGRDCPPLTLPNADVETAVSPQQKDDTYLLYVPLSHLVSFSMVILLQLLSLWRITLPLVVRMLPALTQ